PCRRRVLRGGDGAERGPGRRGRRPGPRDAAQCDPGLAAQLLRVSPRHSPRPEGHAGGAARPGDPGPAGRAATAIRRLLVGLSDRRHTPRQRAEEVRGQRPPRGSGAGPAGADRRRGSRPRPAGPGTGRGRGFNLTETGQPGTPLSGTHPSATGEFPMQVFVTGATGYVGSSVATAFRRAGHRIWGLTRSQAKARRLAQQEIEPVVGDLADPKAYADVAAECAVLVHAAFEYSPNGVAKDKTAIETLIEAGGRGAPPPPTRRVGDRTRAPGSTAHVWPPAPRQKKNRRRAH